MTTAVGRRLIAHNGLATTTQLLRWAYPHERKDWHCDELRHALRALGIKELGRGRGREAPIIWVLN